MNLFLGERLDLSMLIRGCGRTEAAKRDFVDNTARIVSQLESTMLGSEAESRYKAAHADDAKYSFLWSPGPLHELYKQRLEHYRDPLNKDADVVHGCVGYGLEDPPSPPRGPVRKSIFKVPPLLGPEECALIKLTALFVARSGPSFPVALTKRVGKDPRFGFTSSTSRMVGFYRGLISSYSNLVRDSDVVPDATLLKVLFHLADMKTVDLHAFLGAVDCFAYIEDQGYSRAMPPPERLSAVIKRLKNDEDILGEPQPNLVLLTDVASKYPAKWSTLKELGIIKLTAQFEARYGPCFSRDLMKRVDKDPRFEFMRPTDGRFNFYSGRVGAYSNLFEDFWRQKMISDDYQTSKAVEAFFDCLQLEKLEEGVAMAMIDLHAFLGGLDCLADMEDEDYSADSLPLPDRHAVMLYLETQFLPLGSLGSQLAEYPRGAQDIQPDAPAAHECVGDAKPDLGPIWNRRRCQPHIRSCLVFADSNVSLKELAIIKLTAQFVARYGPYFSRDLMKRVDKNPQFEFMKPTHRIFDFYCGLYGPYATVLRRAKKLRKSDAPTGTVLDGFFHRLQSDDIHAFVCGVDCFAYMENVEYSANFPPPERLSVTMNQLKEMQPTPGSQLAEYNAQNQDGAQDIQPDASATHECAQPDLAFGLPTFGITPKKLGIMKLTALFQARYGEGFVWSLWEKVGENPQFEFLRPTVCITNDWFIVHVEKYSRVLRRSDQMIDASRAATILECFLDRLQLEKLEEGVEMAMTDLNAFVGGVDCFAHMEENEQDSATLPPPKHLKFVGMNPKLLSETHLGQRSVLFCGIKAIPGSYDQILPEEPEPKRRKLDESALVPEDQFLSQHPGSSTTSVSVEQTNRS